VVPAVTLRCRRSCDRGSRPDHWSLRSWSGRRAGPRSCPHRGSRAVIVWPADRSVRRRRGDSVRGSARRGRLGQRRMPRPVMWTIKSRNDRAATHLTITNRIPEATHRSHAVAGR